MVRRVRWPPAPPPAGLAEDIGSRLAKAAVIAVVNGEERDLATELARRRRGRHRHRRQRPRAVHDPPLHGPRARPGGARPVPRGHVRHRPAGRGRLLLRLRAARRGRLRGGRPRARSRRGCARSSRSRSRSSATSCPPTRRARCSPATASSSRSSTTPAPTRCRRRRRRSRSAPTRTRRSTRRTRRRSTATPASSTSAAARTCPTRACHLGHFKLMRVAGRLLARPGGQPAAPAHLRHGVGLEEGARGAPPPPRGGRQARPPQARRGARPVQLPRRDRLGPGGVPPEGRARAPAHGGLLAAAPRGGGLRVRQLAAHHQGRPVRDVGPPRVVRRRACSRRSTSTTRAARAARTTTSSR